MSVLLEKTKSSSKSAIDEDGHTSRKVAVVSLGAWVNVECPLFPLIVVTNFFMLLSLFDFFSLPFPQQIRFWVLVH